MVGEGMAAGNKAQTGSAGWGPKGMTRGLEAGGWVGWVSGSPWVPGFGAAQATLSRTM